MNDRPRVCKLLFCSYHSWLDPSSGAALAVRDLLELLAGGGWECRVLCGPNADFPSQESLPQLLSDQHLAYETRRGEEASSPFPLLHYRLGEIQATSYRPDATTGAIPSPREGRPFLALLDRVLERFRPDVLVTYGGHWLGQEIMTRAKTRGAAVVFYLLNFAYRSAEFFRPADAVLVPSRFSAEHYRQMLGLDCTAIPLVINPSRVRCDGETGSVSQTARRYVTFVNPEPAKGLLVFARIADMLGRQRPDIPLLVVEGRGTADRLGQTGVDLRGLENLHVMANTPDPRDFYRVSRAVLMPSLWNESFGRVAVEAAMNGIPVLASRRGALPEALGTAGIFFDIPPHYTPRSPIPPTPQEVAPWVETIVRLWDDEPFYRRQWQQSLAAAQAWRPERLLDRYDAFLRELAAARAR